MTCPRCGARVETGQEYCLECGLRLPGGGLAGAVGSAWQRRIGRRGPDWLWPILAALLVAALMAGLAIAASSEDETRAETIAATGPSSPPVPDDGDAADRAGHDGDDRDRAGTDRRPSRSRRRVRSWSSGPARTATRS